MPISAEELRDATCVVCPAQLLTPGAFDVSGRPGPTNRYDPTLGYRVDVGWIIAVIRAAGPSRLRSALAAAEMVAGERFDERDVVAWCPRQESSVVGPICSPARRAATGPVPF